MISRSVRNFGRSERGQALVETALILPVFLVLVLGIIDFGRAYQQHITVSGAAREGARLGVTGAPESAISGRVAGAAGSLPVAVQVNNACGTAGTPLIVSVQHTYTPVTPIGRFVSNLAGSIALSANADMRLEHSGC